MHLTITEFSLIRTQKHTCNCLMCLLLRFSFSAEYMRSTYPDKWCFSYSSQGVKLTLKRQKHRGKSQPMLPVPQEVLPSEERELEAESSPRIWDKFPGLGGYILSIEIGQR